MGSKIFGLYINLFEPCGREGFCPSITVCQIFRHSTGPVLYSRCFNFFSRNIVREAETATEFRSQRLLVYLFTDSWHWFLWGYFSWTRWHGNTSSRITLDAYCSLYVLRFKVPRAELVTQWLEAIIFKCRFEATDLRREAHLELDCSRLLSLASASVFTVGSNYRNPPQMRFLKNIVKLTLVIVFAAVWQIFWILDRKRKLSGSIFLNLLGKN